MVVACTGMWREDGDGGVRLEVAACGGRKLDLLALIPIDDMIPYGTYKLNPVSQTLDMIGSKPQQNGEI